MFKGLGTVLRWIFTPVIALILLFEEWGWAPLAAALRRLREFALWAWMERKIAQLPPWAALLVLLLPSVGLLPAKLMALWLVRHGQYSLGVCILIVAKLIGTAFLARLFELTQPALMQFAWFARWYPRWKAWKDSLMAHMRASALWQLARKTKLQAKALVRTLLAKLARK